MRLGLRFCDDFTSAGCQRKREGKASPVRKPNCSELKGGEGKRGRRSNFRPDEKSMPRAHVLLGFRGLFDSRSAPRSGSLRQHLGLKGSLSPKRFSPWTW